MIRQVEHVDAAGAEPVVEPLQGGVETGRGNRDRHRPRYLLGKHDGLRRHRDEEQLDVQRFELAMHVEDGGGGVGLDVRRGRAVGVRVRKGVQAHLPQLGAEKEPVVDAADGDAFCGFRLARQAVQLGLERRQHRAGVGPAAGDEQGQGGRPGGSAARDGVRHGSVKLPARSRFRLGGGGEETAS